VANATVTSDRFINFTIHHSEYHPACKQTAAAMGICVSLATYHSYVRLKFSEEKDGGYLSKVLEKRIIRHSEE
jgi:hypothetical protein